VITPINYLTISRYIGAYDEQVREMKFDQDSYVLLTNLLPFETYCSRIEKHSYKEIKGILPKISNYDSINSFARLDQNLKRIKWLIAINLQQSS
jgi:hypothetical protein